MEGIIIVTGIAFVLSLLIVIFSEIFKTKISIQEQIEQFLPGLNCGACGFGSCFGMSKKIVDNINNLENCKIIKSESKEKIQKLIKNEK